MKLCQIYNYPSAYRESIYRLIGETFDTDWVFGSSMDDIKPMDTQKLRGKVTIVKNISLLSKKAYWQTNVVKQLFKKEYTHYLLSGDERCLSTWVFLLLTVFYPQKKIYFWSHGAYGKEGRIKTLIQRFFWSFVDGAVLYGNYAKEVMSKSGFKTKNFHVIHNSLNYNHQLELRNSNLSSVLYQEHFGNDYPVLIFIGRLTKVKQLDMLVDAFSMLIKDGENYNLVFIGDGEERNVLQEKVHNLNLDNNVWFYGACYALWPGGYVYSRQGTGSQEVQ